MRFEGFVAKSTTSGRNVCGRTAGETFAISSHCLPFFSHSLSSRSISLFRVEMVPQLEELQPDMARLNEANCRTPLVQLPPEMFDKIVENLDLLSFLRLTETCKAVQTKCGNVSRGPYFEVDDVHYKDGKIMWMAVNKKGHGGADYYTTAKNGDYIKQRKLQLRCGTLQCHMNGHIFHHDEGPRKFKDEDVSRLLKVMHEWNLKTERLSISDLSCSSRLLEKLVRRFQISEMECHEVAEQLLSHPLWKEMNVLETQTVFPDDRILVEGKFKELRIRLKRLDFKAIGMILQELKEGKRSLQNWCIPDVPGDREGFRELYEQLKDKDNTPLLESVGDNSYKIHTSGGQSYTVSLTEANSLLIRNW